MNCYALQIHGSTLNEVTKTLQEIILLVLILLDAILLELVVGRTLRSFFSLIQKVLLPVY